MLFSQIVFIFCLLLKWCVKKSQILGMPFLQKSLGSYLQMFITVMRWILVGQSRSTK